MVLEAAKRYNGASKNLILGDTLPGPLKHVGSAKGKRRKVRPMKRETLVMDTVRRGWPRLLGSWGLRVALLFAPLLMLEVGRIFSAVTDPDYWWHVRTGRYIYETGTLPRVDIYSYTAAGRPWITHEWLTELLLYMVYQQFGYVGNVVLFSLIGVLTWAVVYATCRRRGVGDLGTAVLVLWGAVMAMGSANVRPQALTTLFLAICMLLLTLYKEGKRGAIWLMPPLMALWVNAHGGYVIGLAVLGLSIVGEILRRPAAPLRPLVLAAGLSAAATLLNPHGLEALFYPFTYAGTSNASMQYIMEWQSPNFHNPYFLIFFGGGLMLAIMLGVRRQPLEVTEALWALAFSLMALLSARHIQLYAVVLVPLLGARLQAEVPAFRRAMSVLKGRRLLAVTCLVYFIGALSMVRWTRRGSTPLQLGREPSAATYPSGAVEYIQSNDLENNLFNEYKWGGYLIYHLYPQQRVFVDGRADVYGDELIDKYVDVSRLRPRWREVIDENDVRMALVEKASPLAVVLGQDTRWREVFVGEVERLFVRQVSE